MSDRKKVKINLGLQGGGSHGAFTWGVLDRLLEEKWLDFEGVSGTSAGAMNAAVMADGYAAGKEDGARAALERFWRQVSDAAAFSPFRRGPLDVLLGRWTLDNSPLFVAMDLAARIFSPYDFVGMGGNPLKDILERTIDFGRLSRGSIKLFVTATNVHTGRGRVFRNSAINADVLMASACLPVLFQAVEIDGEPYWDGGYAGNPTFTPLVNECESYDIVLVPINPIQRPGTPRSARDIVNRLNEISFNAVLLKELTMVALLRRVVGDKPEGIEGEIDHWANMRLHVVPNPIMVDLGYSSKLNAEWAFLTMLRDEGRKAATQFLAEHGDALGKRSTLDLNLLLKG